MKKSHIIILGSAILTGIFFALVLYVGDGTLFTGNLSKVVGFQNQKVELTDIVEGENSSLEVERIVEEILLLRDDINDFNSNMDSLQQRLNTSLPSFSNDLEDLRSEIRSLETRIINLEN